MTKYVQVGEKNNENHKLGSVNALINLLHNICTYNWVDKVTVRVQCFVVLAQEHGT